MEWVAVEERMPPDRTEVLVALWVVFRDGTRGREYHLAEYDSDFLGWSETTEHRPLDRVTHWALVAAPEEEPRWTNF